MNNKPYLKYKCCNVKWVGKIPEHWDMKPLFVVANETKTKNAGMIEENLLSLSYGKIVQKDINTDFGLLPESFDTYQIVEPGDIILRLTDLQNDQRSLRVGYVEERGIITSAYLNLRNKSMVMPKYVFYCLYNYDIQKIFYNYGGGVRQSMRFCDLKWLPIVLPPLSEQQAIATFLDRETSKIDSLIDKKKRLVELLGEKRTALISSAVTKGLDPTVKLKPSGVEWVGDVPEHWEIKRIKHVSQIYGRIGFRGYTTDDLVGEMEGAISLSPSNMRNGYMSLETCTYISWDKYFESPEIMVDIGDILIVKTGSTLGKVAYVEYKSHPMTINPQLAIFKNIKCSKKFLFWYVYSPFIQNQVELSNTGGTIPTMTQATIENYSMPLPPLHEQELITEYLDRETSKIDTLILKVELVIDKLTEYRTSLISAAVTGKIDVRDVI